MFVFLGVQTVCFVCLCLRLSPVNMYCNACCGKLSGWSSPADFCLTAAAEGPGEAVKAQPNKPCVSSRNSMPDITLHTGVELWD